MATNRLTPEQDLIVRQFYTAVVQDQALWAGLNVSPRVAAGACLELLGYIVRDGKFISPSALESTTYGQQQELKCEWEADTKAAEAAIGPSDDEKKISALYQRVKALEAELNEKDSDDTGTDEADSSEPSEDSEVREAVLSEDV